MGDITELVGQTAASLGSLISKPKLTEKYLKKPPFRFLHDIIMEVIRETGFGRGLFSPAESDPATMKEDKAMKVEFLHKIINCVSYAMDASIDISPNKIVAGMEAEKTNLFLQMLHQAATTAVARSDDAVEKVLNGPAPVKEKKKKREPEAAEKPPPEAPPEDDAAAEEERRKKEEERERRRKKREEHKRREEEKLKEEKRRAEEQADEARHEEEKRERQEKKREEQRREEQRREEERREEERREEERREEKRREEERREEKRREEKRREEKRQEAQKEERREPESLPVEREEIEERPLEEPPAARQYERPRTAGRAPPKRTNRVVTKETAPVSREEVKRPQLIKDGDNKDDEDFFEPAVKTEGIATGATNQHGKLVRDILEVKKQEETAKPEAEEDTEQGGIVLKSKIGRRTKTAATGSYTQMELEEMRTSIQTLCQAANPLGKSIDLVHSDIANMGKELDHWKQEYQVASQAYQEEVRQTEQTLNPLYVKISHIEQQIREQEAKIYEIRARTLRNNMTIHNLLESVVTTR